MVEELISAGVHGFITKPFDEQRFIAKFNQILGQVYTGEKQKRRHIRVSPKGKLQFISRIPPHHKLSIGRVVEISLGGFLGDFPLEVANLLTVQQNLIIKFPKFSVEAKAMVMSKKDQFLGLKFTELGSAERNQLSNYIYERLTDGAALKD